MKSRFHIVIIASMLLALMLCSCEALIQGELEALQAQIDALSVRVDQMNESISSMESIVQEIQSGGYVKDYVEIVENGKVIGWKLTFSNGKDLMLYNGKDGATPRIGVRQDTDGEWYWTLNDEWLLRDGQKIRVNGKDGKDGVTPKLKIEEDWWWVSYDDGKTWTKLSQAKGDDGQDGDSFFSSVTRDGDTLILTLGDGSSLVIPCYKSTQMDIVFDDIDIGIIAGGSATVGYTIVGASEKTVVKALGQNGWSARVMPNGADKGFITVQAPDPLSEDEIIVLVDDGEFRTIVSSINFVTGRVTPAMDSVEMESDGGTFEIQVSSNIAYSVSIPDEAKSWVSHLETKSVRTNTLLFKCEPNPDTYRTTIIHFVDASTNIQSSFSLIQYGAKPKNIPVEDANFKAYLVANFDRDGDGEISYAEAAAIQHIFISTEEIASVQGIEYMPNLLLLSADGTTQGNHYSVCGQLTSLDVSNNIALTGLLCDGNQLTSLDVSNNTALSFLACEHNQLTSLDVSNNTALTYLSCSDNPFTTLDVSNQTALTDLWCSDNQLISLDVSNNTALIKLNCGNNRLTSLDVSSCTALIQLGCHDNQLTSLDVSKNTALTELNCYNNQLVSLDVSNNTALTSLLCDGNQLTSLDVSNNIALTSLLCNGNQLTSLDVSNNIALTSLLCNGNQLTSLDVSNNTALTTLWCGGNQLTSLDVSNNIALTSLLCDGNQLTSLDVSNNTALTTLWCGGNQLASLDVSKNTALTELWCSGNQLTSLDVSNNTALTSLLCYGNQLASLDVSKNGSLSDLNCSPMDSLEKLMIAPGQEIPNVTTNRSVERIPAGTQIVVVPSSGGN